MFGVAAPEALFIVLVALLAFGLGRLAQAAREWGVVLGRARRKLDDAKAELTSLDYPDEWFENRDREQEELFDRRAGN